MTCKTECLSPVFASWFVDCWLFYQYLLTLGCLINDHAHMNCVFCFFSKSCKLICMFCRRECRRANLVCQSEVKWSLQIINEGVAMIQWLSSWLAEQGVRGSNRGLNTWISELGCLLPPSRDITVILYKALNSPNLIFAPWRSETDSPSLEFAHPSIFFYNPWYII